ncbi:hypothetical protein HNI00_04090 [Thermoleptolyngbya oregonensis NK1-22]|uniref:Uncharacterized protein n=1 Tax=Thermoleptolyngbya oregonensis NK1-22 TaxID=2547457 RepID=A0AA96Y9C8_9CYAN|nr:hypothetical protein HNI00_04090 [Thermoleptolyngbya oregonensis NK1-22]
MIFESFKRTAIHNIRVSSVRQNTEGILEGLVIPRPLMKLADILPFEQIVVTNSKGKNWDNRIYSFAIPGDTEHVEVCGSLCQFLEPGSLICIITRGFLDENAVQAYSNGELPMVDIGFLPEANLSNHLEDAKVFLEYFNQKNEVDQIPKNILEQRNYCSSRVILSSLICGLEVTATHPDCLQGSAELPEDIMFAAKLNRYRGVFVYNADKGGMAETYAVPMPPGIVMTTGAMAAFAPVGTKTNVAAYSLSKSQFLPTIVNVKNNSSENLEVVNASL